MNGPFLFGLRWSNTFLICIGLQRHCEGRIVRIWLGRQQRQLILAPLLAKMRLKNNTRYITKEITKCGRFFEKKKQQRWPQEQKKTDIISWEPGSPTNQVIIMVLFCKASVYVLLKKSNRQWGLTRLCRVVYGCVVYKRWRVLSYKPAKPTSRLVATDGFLLFLKGTIASF